MREMKDSGVEWIGEISSAFNLFKLKHLLSSQMQYGANESGEKQFDGGIRYIRITDITAEGMLKNDENNQYLPIEIANCYILKDKDVLFARSGGTVGKSFLYRESYGDCAFAGYLIKAECNRVVLLPEYLIYYSQSSLYDLWKNMIFIQATIQNISAYKYSNMEITVPSICIQMEIVEHLDSKCAQIDALLSNVQTQIEKLKQYKQSLITEVVTKGLDPTVPMKDSGVEWIGEIPEGWSLNRIKYICSFNPSTRKKLLKDESVSYAPMDCVKNGYLVPNETTMDKVSSGLTYFENDDIVMAKVTPCFENGNIAIAHDLLNGVGFGSSELFVFRARFVTTKWFMFFLRNTRFVDLCKATMTGTGGLKRVSPIFVASLTIALPVATEQAKIADFLDSKCAQIDRLISIKQAKTEKLNAYKKSLIYEYVTGKKEACACVKPA